MSDNANDSTWKKGQSGNPGGRSPRVGPNGESIAELARGKTLEAFDVLVVLLADEAPDIRLRAANAILDRGWGKPKESIGLENPDGSPLLAGITVRFVKPDGSESVG